MKTRRTLVGTMYLDDMAGPLENLVEGLFGLAGGVPAEHHETLQVSFDLCEDYECLRVHYTRPPTAEEEAEEARVELKAKRTRLAEVEAEAAALRKELDVWQVVGA